MSPDFPAARLNLVRPARPAVARVVANASCLRGKSASFVKHLVLDVGGTPLANAFLPGQSFGVVPPGLDERGRPHKVRLYSIASPSWGEDGAGLHISTTPKRLIDEFVPLRPGDDPDNHELFLGVCSNYLCDLREGDTVQVCGPNGKRFLLPSDTDAHDYLLLATGTGIAPFRGMLLELLENPSRPAGSRIELVMGAPYGTDLLYDDLFCGLAAKHANFRYHTAISREGGVGGGRGRYVADCLIEARDHFAPLLAGNRTLIYMCGILGMQQSVFRALAELGLASSYLKLAPELDGVAPADWDPTALKRLVKPSPRCLLELY